jgi:nucleotidyltransferase substrate binding protein (TIGR01987 family)
MIVLVKNEDIRWVQRFQNFKKALLQLSKAVVLAQQRPLSELEQQGLIQAFEFTHELAWNTLKDFLESRGTTNLYGSKDATRQAFATGLIEHGEIWMDMIQSRNQSTHTFDCAVAEAIAGSITSSYFPEFVNCQKKFMELELAQVGTTPSTASTPSTPSTKSTKSTPSTKSTKSTKSTP